MATDTAPTPSGDAALDSVDLVLTGMTCGACAARIEKGLNKVPGATATVNYATEHAQVRFDPNVASVDALIAAVDAAGYSAAVVPDQTPPPAATDGGNQTVVTAPTAVLAPDPGEVRRLELRQRLVICAILGVPVAVVSMIPALQFRNWQWLALTLASPVAVWGAFPFHVSAWKNLRHRTATMDTLVSIGVITSFGASVAALFWGHAGMAGMAMSMSWTVDRAEVGSHLYLEVVCVLTIAVLTGKYLEARAKYRSGEAMRALLVGTAAVIANRIGPDGAETPVPAASLVVGDRFVVRPGGTMPTDGVVTDGVSSVNAALVTGESVPVTVSPGDAVLGGTINVDGAITVKATAVGHDTALSRIARLVTEAQTGKAAVQRLADKVSLIFVPVVLGIAALTLIFWLLRGEPWTFAGSAAVAVLVVACPCALGLATPTALLVGTGRAAQLGVLIRNAEVLERAKAIDTIVLDKTGTITAGQMDVVDVIVAPSVERADVIAMAAALEAASEHPIGRAIAAFGGGEPRRTVVDFANVPGRGVTGTVDGRSVVVGQSSLLSERLVLVPGPVKRAADEAVAQGRTVVFVAWDGGGKGAMVLADVARPEAPKAIARLKAMGLRPIMLTGDNESVARSVAAATGIDEVIAGVLPEEKAAVIARLRAEGRTVAMAGDGVNDAAALAGADLGIAMGGGTDVAKEASDLTLTRANLNALPDAMALARRTLRVIRSNLFWAFAYNVAAIPLAASGRLNPAIAGAAMAMSSVFVVTNSLRLKRFTPRD